LKNNAVHISGLNYSGKGLRCSWSNSLLYF